MYYKLQGGSANTQCKKKVHMKKCLVDFESVPIIGMFLCLKLQMQGGGCTFHAAAAAAAA